MPTALADAIRIRALHQEVEAAADRIFDSAVAGELGRAYNLSLRMLGDYQSASRAVHKAFSRAREQFSSFNDDVRVSTWMLRFVAEEALLVARHRDAVDPYVPVVPGSVGVEQGLASLDPVHRLAVVLQDVLRLSLPEAAAIMGVGVSDFRQLANDGTEHLRSITSA